jgi:hypothetical protein
MRAASALGLLMQLQTRLDPLCTELLNGLQTAEVDVGVRDALTVALRDVIKNAGGNISQPMLERIVSDLQQVRSLAVVLLPYAAHGTLHHCRWSLNRRATKRFRHGAPRWGPPLHSCPRQSLTSS